MNSSINKFRLVVSTLLCALCLQLTAQNTLTTEQWQEDLKFLQDKVHDDYPFLFKKVTQKKWDSEVEKLYKQIPSMADHEVMVGLARIVSLFEYGHTDIGFRGGKVPYHKLPFNLYHFNDGVYVEGTNQSNEKALGAKVLKIGGTSINDALAKVKPAVPAENDQYFKAFGMVYLSIPEVLHAQGITTAYGKDVTLTLEKDGKTFDHTFTALAPEKVSTQYSLMKQEGEWLSARNQDKTPLYLRNLDKIYDFEYLPEQKTVYVRQSQIQDDPSEDIPTFYAGVFDFIEKNDVEKFVLDVRLNGGGNNYKNKPVITGIIQSKINKVGSFYTIVGRRTFSACQNLVNELDNYTNVIFVGEPSAENVNFYGDNRKTTLPNSELPVYLSFAWWQDKPQWENADWMAPNLFVDMSFDQYKNNQDPVLEAALGFSADSGVILDPMAHLTALFMAGEYEKVGTEAARLVKDPMHQFTDFEAQFNQAGYNMLGSEQVEGAMFVFDMTTKLFEKSANAWFGLAECQKAQGNMDQAVALYTKVSSLEPYGPTGEKARKKLMEIRE
ncbi:MAG: hypothetical protein ABJM06_06960 [Gilvibacter sp.]